MCVQSSGAPPHPQRLACMCSLYTGCRVQADVVEGRAPYNKRTRAALAWLGGVGMKGRLVGAIFAQFRILFRWRVAASSCVRIVGTRDQENIATCLDGALHWPYVPTSHRTTPEAGVRRSRLNVGEYRV